MIRYYHGQPGDMGTVASLSQQSFSDLCSAVLNTPVRIDLTREAFAALPKKRQNEVKRVRYIVPATFTKDPSPRTTAEARACNLIALDVDEAEASKRVLTVASTALGSFGYAIWHTASSKPEAPRVRVIVNADAIPVNRYASAVQTVAGLLGVSPSRESLVPVQPMYLPSQFANGESPVITLNPAGEAFTPLDISTEDEPVDAPDAPSLDLEHLRAPMEGVSLDDMREAIAKIDPDCSMQEWVEVGMGLKHQFGDDGFQLWDEWSGKGAKYDGAEVLETRWGSFKPHPANRAPVTIRSVIKKAIAAGWKCEAVAAKARTDLASWINSPTRSTEELLDKGATKIAQSVPLLGLLERKGLMATLRSALGKREVSIQLSDIQKSVRKAEIEEKQKAEAATWTRGFCYVTARDIFYQPQSGRTFEPKVIDLMYSVPSISIEGEAAMLPKNYLIQVANVPQVENLRYEPRMGIKRFFQDDGIPFVNTYRPSKVVSNPERADEAGELFLAHIRNLVSEPEYQRILIDFLAYQVQHPGKKVRWAVLLQGAKGCGKGFLGDAMGVVLGDGNVSILEGNLVLTGNNNDWAYGHQLCVINEIRVVGANRHAVMDKLKPLISDDRISLNVKYENHRTVPNVTNYLMFTNYQDALAVDDDDRRYFVLCSALQRAEQVAVLGPTYFDDLFGMLKDNAGGLKAWLEEWKISEDFKPEGRAPKTKYLRELAENSASPLCAAVRQAIAEQPSPLVRQDLVSMHSLREYVAHQPGINEFSDQALAAVLREMGWVRLERVMIDGQRHQMWAHAGARFKDLRKTAIERMELL
jgi:hypothetical protein